MSFHYTIPTLGNKCFQTILKLLRDLIADNANLASLGIIQNAIAPNQPDIPDNAVHVLIFTSIQFILRVMREFVQLP